MSDKLKQIKVEPCSAVICDENGIIRNGLRRMCPHCQTVYIHANGHTAFNTWTVGGIEQWQCSKCRKNHKTITLNVPLEMTPEEFYRVIFPEGTSAPATIYDMPVRKIVTKKPKINIQLTLADMETEAI